MCDDLLQELVKVVEELPEEKLLDFDAFLIGDGSAKFANRKKRCSSNFNQLTGLDSLKARLQRKESVDTFSYKKDIETDYVFDTVQLVSDPLAFVKDIKFQIFSKYGFFIKKSELMNDMPVYEDDFLLTSQNYHLLDLLKSEKKLLDRRDLTSLATLFAYVDMHVEFVRFVNKCFCPLCEVYHNIVLSVDAVLTQLVRGFYVHPFCVCEFLPVFSTSSIISELYKTCEINGILCKNVPIEQVESLTKILTSLDVAPFAAINFTDIDEFFKKNNIFGENNVIIYPLGDTLYVHNSYIWDYSPVDFLYEYLSHVETEVKSSDILASGKVVYIKGAKFIEVSGQFYDPNTGCLVTGM